MTERLSATGRNTWKRVRRLLLPPPPPSLPRAYTSLLLDPADLLNAAWGAMLSASNAVNTQATDYTIERRASEQRAEARVRPTAFQNRTQRLSDAGSPHTHVGAQGDGTPLRPTPASPHNARRARRPNSPAPFNLPVPFSSPAPFDSPAGSQARPTTLESSRADNSSFRLSSSRSETGILPSENIRATTPPRLFARPRFDHATDPTDTPTNPTRPAPFETSLTVPETTAVAPVSVPRLGKVTAATGQPALRMRGGDATPQSQTNATGTSNDDNKSVRAFLPTPSSLPPPSSAETRASSAVIASSREGERAPESVLHLAQSPSRLAAVLNANLASRTPTPGESVETEVVSTDALVERPRFLREGLNAQQTTLDILRPPGEAAQEGSGGLSVEAVIEELYERLRLEFLRTYGTSGE